MYDTKCTTNLPNKHPSSYIQATVNNPSNPTPGIIGVNTDAALVTVGVDEELLPLAEEEEPIEPEPEPEPAPALEPVLEPVPVPEPALEAELDAEVMLLD